MGTVHDIYMRYVSSGDQFVGRCLSLLSVIRTNSPPYFIDEELYWIENARLQQFQSIGRVNGMEKITSMCLAGIIYHWTLEFLDVNNVFIVSSYIHCIPFIAAHCDSVCVTYLWNDSTHHFLGIPPHVVAMQSI